MRTIHTDQIIEKIRQRRADTRNHSAENRHLWPAAVSKRLAGRKDACAAFPCVGQKSAVFGAAQFCIICVKQKKTGHRG